MRGQVLGRAAVAVALVGDGGERLAVRSADERRRHAETLAPLISEVLAEAGVDPQYHHLGIGSVLLTALIDRSRQVGASAVLLEVAVDNDAALAMYGKFGFEQLGIRKRYYQPEDVDAYTMRLELTDDATAPVPAGREGDVLPDEPGVA